MRVFRVEGRRKGEGDDAWVLYDSVADAAAKLNVTRAGIRSVCAGKWRHTAGYEFRRANAKRPVQVTEKSWSNFTLGSPLHASAPR